MKAFPMLAAALLCAPLAVLAHEPPAQDASQDRTGKIDAPALNATIEVHFNRLDNDEDGMLTLEEIPSDYVLYRDFARWDDNSDGVINMREFDHYVDYLADN